MLALYHFDRSTAAQKVRLALAEKGLAWESRYVDPSLGKRQQHDAAYLALNPRGVVPTLIHDGKVLRESQVILEYLEDVFPAPALRPADPFARAQMRLWTKLIDEFLHVDSRTIGQCVAMRFVTLTADKAVLKQHYDAMPEEVRRDNDRINNEHGLASPLLPGAIRRFKRVFLDIEHTLADAPWLAGAVLLARRHLARGLCEPARLVSARGPLRRLAAPRGLARAHPAAPGLCRGRRQVG